MTRKLPILALLLVGLVGCTYNTLPDDVAVPVVGGEQGFDLNFSTRAEVFDGKQLDSEYFVAEQDLESYLTYKQQHSGKKITVKNCTPYGFDGGHTLFYVLNYADGWEVVSADKRTQATLAYGDGSRTFSMEADNTNEAEKFWMELLASDVLRKRQRTHSTRSAEGESLVADEEEQSNVAFWNRVCNNSTRVIEVGSTSELSSPNTVYYVLGTTTSDTTLIDKGPYLKTKWGQEWPWNKKCPASSSTNPNKAVVGCVAVAGAQLLYYFYDEMHWVLPMPTSVWFTGYGPLSYQMTATNFSTQPWGALALDRHAVNWVDGPIDLVATLLAWVGGSSNLEYNADITWGYLYKLANFFETQFGIYCDYTYDPDKITNIIRNEVRDKEKPVLLRGDNDEENGHVWLIDGYKLDVITDSVYYIVSNTAIPSEELAQMDINDATHVIRYELEDEYVRMNWGWDGNHDGFYAIMSSGWQITTPTSYYYFGDGVWLYYNFTKQ